jgi:hypothetical protein
MTSGVDETQGLILEDIPENEIKVTRSHKEVSEADIPHRTKVLGTCRF